MRKRLGYAIAALGIAFSTGAAAVPIAGSTSGIFENPTGPAGMVTTGVGTSTFTWGNGAPFGSPPSSLSFSGTSFSGSTGVPFAVGSITYFNGTIAGGTEANTVDLAIALTFTDPAGVNQSLSYLLSLINTPNTGDPVASADIIQFPATLPTETFDVGGVLYTLALDVGIVSGGGFSSQHTFSVFEGQSATATLIGTVTVPTAVPEPGIVGLISMALVLGSLTLRRRKSASH
jgi:hypothetical protein